MFHNYYSPFLGLAFNVSGTVPVPQTLDIFSELMWLNAYDDFKIFSCNTRLKSCGNFTRSSLKICL